YGEIDAADLHPELTRRLAPGSEIVMVHCSLNGLQPMYRGAVRELLDALALCGPSERWRCPPSSSEGQTGTQPSTTGAIPSSMLGASRQRWGSCPRSSGG